MVAQSLLFYLKNVPHNYNYQMVQRISAVTIEDINRIAPQYIKPLFDPNVCKTTIVSHPSNVTEIADAFKTMSHELEVYTSLEKSYLSEW